MPSDNGLESRRRFSDIVYHREFDVAVSDDVGISLVLLVSLLCSLLYLESWLIEEDVITHYNRLN